MIDRLWHKIKRRPVRVAEAVLALLGTVGIVLLPEAEDAVYQVIGALVAAGILGGEASQRSTTALSDPRSSDGTPLTPVDVEHVLNLAARDGVLTDGPVPDPNDPESS